jgi:hypothetical protein
VAVDLRRARRFLFLDRRPAFLLGGGNRRAPRG